MFCLKTMAITATLTLGGMTMAAPGAAPAAMHGDETAAAYKRLADEAGPALVSVKFILKFEGGDQFGMGGDDGREMEVTALMIEPTGLVLCSNTKMGGFAAMMGMFGGPGGMNANPTDVKVLAGDDTEGLKARVLARDTDLDLCWVQIDDEKAKGKTFKHVDLKATPDSPAAIGDKLMTVQRRGKFFDRALVVSEGRVGGLARKPRPLIIPSGVEGDLGMPMFTPEGKVVGLTVLQMPSREDMEGGDMSDMFEMGGGGPVMVLPAEEVAKATERGKALGATTGGDSAGAAGAGEGEKK